MNNAARHRGPDDEGYVVLTTGGVSVFGGNDTPHPNLQDDVEWLQLMRDMPGSIPPNALAFGHRRLSIIDLSPLGHQPMSYRSRFWITYNGEVYNYREIKRELEHLGHRFYTSSDTEVILGAYAEWGQECLTRFIGMWAFAIYDCQTDTLFLARDRFGIKPLYYSFVEDGLFAFASEIKQFSSLPGWRARLNVQRAYDFLVWSSTDHSNETMFAGVFQIEPGAAGLFTLDSLRNSQSGAVLQTKKWYVMSPGSYQGTFEDAASEFRNRFLSSVSLHLRSDVPVGYCLSGGLDSSAIVCSANTLFRKEAANLRQVAFTASSEDSRLDETHWARIVVDATGIEHQVICPHFDEMFAGLEKLVWYQDEPPGGPSLYAQWCVFELAASHGMKVILDGQGSDEQLAGYHLAFAPFFGSLARRGDLARLRREFAAVRELFGYDNYWSLQMLADSQLPASLRQFARRLAGRAHHRPKWLNVERLNVDFSDPFERFRDGSSNALRNYSIKEMCHGHLQMLLHWEDRASMAHSIESRVPFVEHQLAEFVISLPDEFKLRDGIGKRVLREGLCGILPEPIRSRRNKIGFAVPEQDWFQTHYSKELLQRTANAVDYSQGLISPEVIASVRRMVEQKHHYSLLPWRIIYFGEWMRIFGVVLP
jgi:asparagine synthase (glutamine-hydrolysing)